MYIRFMRALARRAGVRVFRFYRRPLASTAAAPPFQGLQLQVMSERDVIALCSNSVLDLAPDKVADAYARGDFCVAAFDKDKPAGYCWLAFAPLPHLDGVWVDFDGRAAWLYKSFVLASHRGRGIAPALYRFADRVCLEKGRSHSLICVESHNRPSISAARSAGYATAGLGAYWRRGGKLRFWLSPGARDMAVRFFSPQRGR